ncbi:hypothetical protein FSP39_005134 [Pinctada imbricata]|uniref:Uncharacterized protein n=1 Tax=Pinctada imbricata TaxID=66713 RepID=A0AA89C6L1_PINIB|nr:hypothetical protein FSP39_005134 [Pinctada imbricata]
MESNLENKLTQKMKSSMDARLGEVRQEMNEKITEVRNEVEMRVSQLKKSYANVAEGKDSAMVSNISKSIVIKMLPEKRGEPNDADATKNNVNALIRDGLRLRDIKVVSAKRKQNKNSKNPGVVTFTLETKEQKEKLIKEKSKLKSTEKYKRVYIEEEMSKEQLSADQNMRTILKETGIDRHYYVHNGNIRKRQTSDENVGRREHRRDDTRGRGSRGMRGGRH